MPHNKFGLLLKVVYFHLLAFGLVATTLDLRRPWRLLSYHSSSNKKVPASYLVYSFCCTCLMLVVLVLPFLATKNATAGYMSHNLVLQSTFLIQYSVRVIAMIGYCGLVWICRHSLLSLYCELIIQWRSYRIVLRRVAGRAAIEQLHHSLGRLLGYKLFVNYAMLACSITIQYHLARTDNGETQYSFLVRIFQMYLLMVARIGFYTVLLLLDLQFECVNLALSGLFEKLASEQRVGKLYYQNTHEGRHIKDLQSIIHLHMDSFLLARRIFRLLDIPNAGILLNMFIASVTILYHAVQYGNASIASDGWHILVGNGLILFNCWNSFMFMDQMDRLLRDCNDTGQLLCQFNDLGELDDKFHRKLELLASDLRTHRLVYKICGCIELNKPTCLNYICSVLIHVIILMQFDLRRQ